MPTKSQAQALTKILNQTLDCVFIFDAQTLRFTYVNAGALRQTGYTEDELLALTPTAIKPYFSEEQFEQLLQPLIKGDEPSIVFQTYHRHKKGHEIAVEIFLQYIKLEDVGASFVAIVRDITDRNLAEQALKESEERFRILARHAPVGILRADKTGACTFINERWGKIAGISEAEASNAGWTLSLHPSDTPLVKARWHNLVTRSIPFDLDYRFLHKNGTEVWVEAKAIAVFDSNQNVTGFLATITDISERRRIEQKLQDTQKLESLGLLAGGIAHDFNNLLTTILGNASLAGMEIGAASPIQKYLQRINDGAVRAADLCKQLLAYSGEGQFVVQNLCLNEVIEETTHLLQISISKKAVLSFNLHENLPSIEADPTQIRQILMNLVINASEAIGDKSGIISLNTGLTRVDRTYLGGTMLADDLAEGTYVYLEVSDNGCGMTKETLSKVFDPFFTTKFEGRGLGLSASIGIMRGHKGTLKVYSEVNRGTTFKLLFPCAHGEAQALPKPNEATDLRAGTGRLLIVDDEESIRSTLAQMAESLGYSFDLAADGRIAVNEFQANPDRYSLVLMDLTMPHLNGELAFAEMRKIRQDIPVVLMSGFNKQRAIARFAGKGLSGFIEKPFTIYTLATVLDRILAIEKS